MEHSTDVADLLNANRADGTLLSIPVFNAEIPTRFREAAVFSDATLHVSPQLDVGFGLRYAANYQSYTQQGQGLAVQMAHPFQITRESAASHETVPTFLINPRYRLTDSSILYMRVASGYRPGGPNFIAPTVTGQSSSNPTFSADRLWNYELGEKSSFLHKRATLDFDVYYIDWSNIQLEANVAGINQLENAGKAKIYGAEASGSFKLSRLLTLGGNMSYTQAQLAEDAPSLGAKNGQPLPLSPRFSTAMTVDYRFPLWDGTLGAAGISNRFVGSRASGYDGSAVIPQYQLHSYDEVDLRCGLQIRNLDVGLYLKNVFNQLGEVSADTSTNVYVPDAPVRVTVTQPRTVGLTATLSFDQ
jgi:outer membrane receptor protein involved in Fe transport